MPFTGGQYQWRQRGERHKWNPATIAKLQAATRANDRPSSRSTRSSRTKRRPTRAAARSARDRRRGADARSAGRGGAAIRDREALRHRRDELRIISAEAHETLAIAMNRLGARSNSGEGGEESRRYVHDANGDCGAAPSSRSLAPASESATEYLVNADELQIKIAQGAKPGEGGQLPATRWTSASPACGARRRG